MPRRLLARLRGVCNRLFSDEEDEDEPVFTPSRMDAGVLWAHGKGGEANREIERIKEEARKRQEHEQQ